MKTKTSDEAEGLKKLLQQEKCKSRQLEKALRRSEEKYREIFEIITDIHFSASPDGRIIDISPWHAKKVAAAMCHKTQHAMFLRNSGAPSVPHMIWKTETFHIWQGPLPQDL